MELLPSIRLSTRQGHFRANSSVLSRYTYTTTWTSQEAAWSSVVRGLKFEARAKALEFLEKMQAGVLWGCSRMNAKKND